MVYYAKIFQTAIADEKPPKKEKAKPKKINAKSRKRIEDDKEYNFLKKEFLIDKYCPITKKKATEVHHTYSGKDRNAHYLDVETWIAVSRKGHNWIHDNPKEARELGYLK
jgi:hypothetical protein